MIEKKMLLRNRDDLLVKEFIEQYLDEYGISNIDIYRTPIGTRITITCLRARALLSDQRVLRELGEKLKKKFKIENAIFEVKQVENPYLDPKIVAFLVGEYLKKFGLINYKKIGYQMVKRVLAAGARGVEILMSGPITSDLHKTFPFRGGYLPKSGEPNKSLVKKAVRHVKLKRAVIGVQVRILPGDVKMPDDVEIIKVPDVEVTAKKEEEGK